MTIDATMNAIRSLELEALAEQLRGDLVLPGDVGWDDARRAWALTVDQCPAAVARPADAHDVSRIVIAAASLGLRVTAQATGHNAAPLGPLDDTVLIRTDRMRGVEIDARTKIARVEAGALWADLTPLAAQHGLAGLAGTASDVGIVGYTLGGGLSWFARSHGLAANSVTAIEVVTADGARRRVDERSEPELFWALRGGGGSFAIVTALEFRLYPIHQAEAGAMFWPVSSTAEVVGAWRDWSASLPTSVTTLVRVLRMPDAPGVPASLAGHDFVVVEAVVQEDPAEAERLLAPMRALHPRIDTVATTPVAELARLHMDPPEPVPGVGDGFLLDGLSDREVADFAAFATAPASAPLMSVEFRLLGGELAPGRGEGGVVADLDGGYAVFAVGVAPFPEAVVQVNAAIDGLRGLFGSGTRRYLNFAERPVAAEAIFGAETERLRRVKQTVDPEGRIRGNHEPGRD